MRTIGLTAVLMATMCIHALASIALAHTPPSRKPSKKKSGQASVAARATIVEWSAR